MNHIPGLTDKLFGSRIPQKILSNFFFFIFNKKNFFDSGPGSRRQIFSKNVSIDPSTINFKLKIIKFVSLKWNLTYGWVYFRKKLKKGGLKLKLDQGLKWPNSLPPCFWTNSELSPQTKILLEGVNIQGFRVVFFSHGHQS